MKETKVVQINSECGRGSTGKIAVAISKQMTEKGIENYIFYSGNHKSDYPLGRMISGKMSIRVHQILSRLLGDQGFHSTVSTYRLVRSIKKIQPDAILLHNLHGYYLNLRVLFRFLRDYDKPVYWTLHDCWAFTGHCTHFTVAQCEKWKNGCRGCSQKHKYPYSWFLDRSRSLYKKKKELFTSVRDLTVITPSEWLADLTRQSFLGKYPVKVIHNGINLSVFQPTESDVRQKYGIGNRTMILGVASVWGYYKGLDMFLELYKRVKDTDVCIVLVGTDDAVDRQLPEGIISIHRTQNQKELAELYSAADVFVNPTREENYPTVNMEAIACGTPVVTFRTGGAPEIVLEGCGAVTDRNTIDSLEEKINQTLQNRQQMSLSCEKASKSFDEVKCFKEYVELICH